MQSRGFDANFKGDEAADGEIDVDRLLDALGGVLQRGVELLRGGAANH